MKKMMIRILVMLTMWVMALFTKAHEPRWFLPIITANGPTTFCAGGSVTLTSSPGVSYLWSSGETTQSITVTTSGSYTVTVTYANSNSETSAATIVSVNPAPVIISATVSPATICAGSIANLNVNVQGASSNSNYNLTSIPFAPVVPAGPVTVLATGGVAVTPMSINNLDDGAWDNIPLPSGFTFRYYGTTPATFSVSTNGFMTFGPTGGSYCCFGQLLPNTGSPNNYIAMAHEDWALSTSGTMDYFVNGVAPFRKFVVRAIAVPHFGNSGAPTTAMIVLNETYNTIEMHLTSVTSGTSDFTTQAIESSTGTLFTVVPDRNRTVWSASNEGWLFSPPVYSYAWTPTTGLNNASINNPVSSAATSTTYSVKVTNNNTGCSTTSAPVTLSVNPADHFVCPPDMNETITDVSCSKVVNTANPVFCTLPEKLTWKLTGATLTSSPASGINYVGLRKMSVGITTVSYTATFEDGTVKTCSFNITVKETIPPEISCPPDIHVNTDPGKCFRADPVNLGNPKTSDNCGVASVTNNAPTIYIKGVNFVSWTITDKSGNTRTCVQRVTVNDVEKPTLTCPPEQTLCKVPYNIYTIPPLMQADNCGILSSSYKVTGATNRIGVGTNASGIFNQGVSTINWTVKDVNGDSSTCTTKITILPNTNSYCAPVPELLLTAWPNPSKNYFNLKVQSTTKEMIEIRMIDMAGKLVQAKKGAPGDTHILGNNVVSGMYIIEVMQAGKTARTKVIKN